ncbi:MAG: DUF512 domain-containing protein [Clostridia bacterium]|nr:DUF512 domain-containing protein [Clostridia bacterium]
MVEITNVTEGSPASFAGIKPLDILISIDGNDINDVLDYRFYLAEKNIALKVKRGDNEYTVNIEKEEYEDIGLEFERPLMDKKHSCENRCVFCFIDQLPRGMRKTLYFKDDDSRLSFLHGNYITLTNLNDSDIDRIIKMRISPVNISVHTTNPELRVQMMNNKRAGEVLKYLKRLADSGISLCTQIVLCRGLNDGDELLRTMRDLASLSPSLVSCSVVPAGLTRFREKLYPLSPYTKEECGEVIDTVNSFGDECLIKYGTRLFFCSDEFYLRAEREMPSEEYYEGYSQLENGVGMITSLRTEVEDELRYFDEYLSCFRDKYPNGRGVSVATGVAAFDCVSSLAQKVAEKTEGLLKVRVYKVINNFFGESITVSGLLTGSDMLNSLSGEELYDELLIPENTLKADEDIFLDDMTPAELSRALGVKVTPSGESGEDFIKALMGI